MGIIGTTTVPAKIAPSSDLDVYPTHDEKYGLGGYRAVATISDRNAITQERRSHGMKVFVTSTSTEYVLGAGLLDSDWKVVKTYPRVLSTWNDLSTMDATGLSDSTEIFVQGRAAVGDGGEGAYWYSASSTIPAIPGLVIIPVAGGGRFLRRYGSSISPDRDMGANNTLTGDSWAILQAALDFAAEPTYGWAKDAGSDGRVGLAVELIGAYTTSAPLVIKGAVELRGAKTGSRINDFNQHASIHVKHGGHGIIYDLYNDDPHYRSPTIRNLALVGYVETYQQNKKSINSVVSRTVFRVADADAPSGLDNTEIYPENNLCFFYDDQNNYLGCGVIASMSSSAGLTTITLESGTDTYSSVNASPGGLLTASCKVVFTPLITDEALDGVASFRDPASAGSCGIFIKSTRPTGVFAAPILDNLYIRQFHSGIRIGPRCVGGCWWNNINIQFFKFAGICVPRTIHVTDHAFNGLTYISGYTRQDYGASGRTNVIDTPALTYGTYGIHGVPSVSKWDRVLVEECAYANVLLCRTISVQMNHLFVDGVLRYGVLVGPGYNVASGDTTTFLSNTFEVGSFMAKNQLDVFPYDTIHSDLVAVKWRGFSVNDRPTFFHCDSARFVRSSSSGYPIFTAAIDLGSASRTSRFTFGHVIERNGCSALYPPGNKPPEQLPIDFKTAAEVQTGWYADATKRAFAFNGNDILQLGQATATIGSSASGTVPLLAVVGNGNAVAKFSRASGSPQDYEIHLATGQMKFRDSAISLDALSMFTSTSSIQIWIGSNSGNASLARSCNIFCESRVGGVDLDPNNFNLVAPGGTGASSANGCIGLYTANPTTSGSTGQTVTLKLQLQRSGQLRFIGITPTLLGEGDLWFDVNRGFRQYFIAADRPAAPKRIGSITLVAGTATFNTSAAKSTSLLFTSLKSVGGTPGRLTYTINDGVSFTINSDSPTDTSTVNWQLWEP